MFQEFLLLLKVDYTYLKVDHILFINSWFDFLLHSWQFLQFPIIIEDWKFLNHHDLLIMKELMNLLQDVSLQMPNVKFRYYELLQNHKIQY